MFYRALDGGAHCRYKESLTEICLLFWLQNIFFMIDNRAGLDERPHFAASRLGLHCLMASFNSKLCIFGLT